MSDTPSTIHGKLLAVQAALKAPKENRSPMGYSYRSCEDILEALKPLLKEQGLLLTLSDSIEMIGNRFYVKATAMVSESPAGPIATVTAYAREEEEKKGTDAAKITGAASSYARKYALNGLFCIDDTKDADAVDERGKAAAPSKKPMQTAPAKPAPAKEKLPPTKLKVMEDMNAEKDKAKFQGIYDGAFKFPWSEADAKDLADCYVSGICRLTGWIANGPKTQLYENGKLKADVVRDKPTGKVTIVRLPEKPQEVIEEEEKTMADAEQKAKDIDSATPAAA